MNRLLYEEHYEAVLKYIVYSVNDEHLAQDILQETFIKFFKIETTITYTRTYLLKIARNLIYDHFRRRKIIQFFSLKPDEPIQSIALPEMVVEKNEQIAQLYFALQTLPIKYREAVILRYIENYTVKETAMILQCNEVKVKNNTARGLKQLRLLLEGGELDGRNITT